MNFLNKNKKGFFILLIISLFICFASSAFAAEGDIPVLLSYKGKSIGTGFYRNSELWIPAESAKEMGINITVSEDEKSFLLHIENPAQKLDLPVLSTLTGNSLSLAFPLVKEEGVNYFAIANSLAPVTGVTCTRSGNRAAFSPSDGREELSYSPRKITGTVSLVWDHITKESKLPPAAGNMRGINVVSPTWFNLTGGNGTMANRASASYVSWSHEQGYSVWPIFSNGFSQANTTWFFRNQNAKKQYIARLLAYARLYKLDGVNIDFENVDINDRQSFVSFMAELHTYTKAAGLTLSVDVHVPSNSNISRSHNRALLANHSDYVMLMAYDEHWRTCPRSGSVASLPWVERAVQNTIGEGVPAEKLILGVPFYMRLWEEKPAGNKKVKVKAYTLTMPACEEKLRSLGISPRWDTKTGQGYFSYRDKGKTYKVWIENKKSLGLKAALVKKYGLTGIAGWRLYHNTPDIFPLLDGEYFTAPVRTPSQEIYVAPAIKIPPVKQSSISDTKEPASDKELVTPADDEIFNIIQKYKAEEEAKR